MSKTFGGIVETIFFSLFFFFCKSYVNGQRREKGRKKDQRGVVEFQKFCFHEFVFSCTVPRFLKEKPGGSRLFPREIHGAKGNGILEFYKSQRVPKILLVAGPRLIRGRETQRGRIEWKSKRCRNRPSFPINARVEISLYSVRYFNLSTTPL